MANKIVYGIYQGCIYEGGGVGYSLYFSKDAAIKQAKKLVRKEQRERKSQFDRSEKDKGDIHYYNEYRWKKHPKIKDYWDNSVDCISIQEFELII